MSGDHDDTTDTTTERDLLAATLRDPTITQTLAGHLNHDDWYEPLHADTWQAITLLVEQGHTTPDAVASLLTGALTGTNGHRKRLDPTFLPNLLTQPTGYTTLAPQYATQIRDTHRLRQLDQIGNRLKQAAKGDPDDVQAILERELEHLDKAATRFGPTTGDHGPTGVKDLTWLLTGEIPRLPAPTYSRRADGHALFYAGVVNGIFGDPDAAKTWLAMTAMLEAIQAGQLAIYIDVDHNGEAVAASRLLLLGAKPEQLANQDLFIYSQPDSQTELQADVTRYTKRHPAVAVLDSIGEIVPMCGGKSVDNDDLSTVFRSICQPFADAGAATITIDHLPKAQDARNSGYAIGGTAKKRAIRGAYIHAEVVGNLKPKPGAIGKIALRVEKDTRGELLRTLSSKYVGHFIVDSTDEHCTKTSIETITESVNKDGLFRPTHLMEAVSRYVEVHPESTGKEIEEAVRGRVTALRAAVLRLLEEGCLEATKGQHNRTEYTSVKSFREADEEVPDELF